MNSMTEPVGSTSFTRTPQSAGHLLWISIAYLLSRVPFVHQNGFPDLDQQNIALGVLDGILSGSYFHGDRLYGLNFSFGYYAAHFSLAPLYKSNPSLIFSVMNWSGVVAGLLSALAIHRFVGLFWGTAAALVTSLCWTFSSGWWELTTFGHPSTIAMSLFLCTLACFAMSLRQGSGRSSWWFAATAVLYFTTLTVRADFLIGATLLLALPLLSERRGGGGGTSGNLRRRTFSGSFRRFVSVDV